MLIIIIKLLKIIFKKLKKYFFNKKFKIKKFKFETSKYLISKSFLINNKDNLDLNTTQKMEPFVNEVLQTYKNNNINYNITYILHNHTEKEKYNFYFNLIQNLKNDEKNNIKNFFIIDLMSFFLLENISFIEDFCDLISIIIAKFSIIHKNKKIILFIKPIEKIIDFEIKNEEILKRINPTFIVPDFKLVYLLNLLNKSLIQNINIKIILSLNFDLKNEPNSFQDNKIIDFSRPKVTSKNFSSFLPNNYIVLN